MHLPFVALPHVPIDETAKAAAAGMATEAPHDAAAFFLLFGSSAAAGPPFDGAATLQGEPRLPGRAGEAGPFVKMVDRAAMNAVQAGAPPVRGEAPGPGPLGADDAPVHPLTSGTGGQGRVVGANHDQNGRVVNDPAPPGPAAKLVAQPGSGALNLANQASEPHRDRGFRPGSPALSSSSRIGSADEVPGVVGDLKTPPAVDGAAQPRLHVAAERAELANVQKPARTEAGRSGESARFPDSGSAQRMSRTGLPAEGDFPVPGSQPAHQSAGGKQAPDGAKTPLQATVGGSGEVSAPASRPARTDNAKAPALDSGPPGKAPIPPEVQSTSPAPIPGSTTPRAAPDVVEPAGVPGRSRPPSSAGGTPDFQPHGAPREGTAAVVPSRARSDATRPGGPAPQSQQMVGVARVSSNRAAPAASTTPVENPAPDVRSNVRSKPVVAPAGISANGAAETPETSLVASGNGRDRIVAAPSRSAAGPGLADRPAGSNGVGRFRWSNAGETRQAADGPEPVPPGWSQKAADDAPQIDRSTRARAPQDGSGQPAAAFAKDLGAGPPTTHGNNALRPIVRAAGSAEGEVGGVQANPARPTAPGDPPIPTAPPTVDATATKSGGVPGQGVRAVDPVTGNIDTEPRMSEVVPVETRNAPASPGGPEAPGPARPELARNAVLQIAEVIRTTGERAMELRLQPEELGRVSMTMTQDGAGLSVALAADRPETMDLIRRHIDLLAEDLRRLGYATVSFSFDGGSDQRSHRDPDASDVADNRLNETDAVAHADAPRDGLLPDSPATTSAAGMDIRL